MAELFLWTLPNWIPAEPWQHFVAMRLKKKSRNPWTDLARDRAIEKLAKMRDRGVDIAEVLLTCAEFGWVGVEWGEEHLAKRQRSRPAGESRHLQALRHLQEGKACS